jgi:leucine-rich repeat protein SHOC2
MGCGASSSAGAGIPGRGSPSTSGSAVGDADALKTWRASSPALQSLWPLDVPISGWEGVTLDARDRVIKVVLDERGLSGAVPACVGKLGALRELDVSYNALTSVPETLGRLSHLRSLTLSNNHLTSVPKAVGNLLQLERLELYFNRLTSLPADLGKLRKLKRLDIKRNPLKSIPTAVRQLEDVGVYMCVDDDVATA